MNTTPDLASPYTAVNQPKLAIQAPPRSFSHTITSLEVPRWAYPDRPAELRCVYSRQPGDPPLHSVKWYRDHHEIFRYTPQEFQTQAFNGSGVSIVSNSCDTRACVVRAQADRGAARYTCEVSSEGPRFAVDKRSAEMTVAVLPEYDPLITGLPTMVYPGDEVRVNCTSDYSLPAAHLDWFVDDDPSEDNEITGGTHISGADSDGLRASWRMLHVVGDTSDNSRGYMSLRCRATVPTHPTHVRTMAVRLYVARRPHISMFTANSNDCSEQFSSRSSMFWTFLVMIKTIRVPFT